MLADLPLRAAAVLTAHLPTGANGFPDPGHGVAPPGGDKILQLIRWGLWLATGACVLAAVMVGAQLALAAGGRGDHHRHGGALVWVLLGAVLVGSSTAIVSALM
jgi:hypothetical protein